MSARFYVNLPLAPGPFHLDGAEAHHLAAVCRLRPGAEVCLFNGDGHEYPARITSVHRKDIALDVLRVESPQRELGFTLEIAAPVPKGDRAQFLIEKLTELGVTAFVPLICERSNLHPRDSKPEKIQRYVIEASKQCGRNVLMNVATPMSWASCIGGGESADLRIVAHPGAPGNLSTLLAKPASSIRIALGPEGGLTDAEVAAASHAGWTLIGLGPRILRVETAAIVLATICVHGIC